MKTFVDFYWRERCASKAKGTKGRDVLGNADDGHSVRKKPPVVCEVCMRANISTKQFAGSDMLRKDGAKIDGCNCNKDVTKVI